MNNLARQLAPTAQPNEVAALARVLTSYGEPMTKNLLAGGLHVQFLRKGQKYRDVSPMLSSEFNVDRWPHPPQGLFVVPENTVYIREHSPMTLAHELGHAIDRMVGGGTYFSGKSPNVRRAFANAKHYVTPYAACGLDEYFAEGMRAWVGINDPASLWPRVSREKLLRFDPQLYAIIEKLFHAHNYEHDSTSLQHGNVEEAA